MTPPAPLVLPEGHVERLIARHAGRPYHSWDHVRALLAAFVPADFARPAEAWAAIVYHDAVYVPGATDNEARSADLARAELAGQPIDLDRVAAAILLTARHGKLGVDDVPDADHRRFLDLDVGILAAEPAAYDVYARAVRQEFAAVPDAAWAAGRRRFVDQVLAAPRIFLTDDLHAAWDARARANLRRERAALG